MIVFIRAHQKSNRSSGKTRTDKWAAVLETVVVTFLITLIPSLIDLGRPPTSIVEVWVPILSSVLMAIYTYMRMRGIEE